MSKREPSVLLDDIRSSIEKIKRYIADLDEASFLADDKTIDAVVRNLEIIGRRDTTITGRVFAASPRSASQTSPGRGLIQAVQHFLFDRARANQVERIFVCRIDDL